MMSKVAPLAVIAAALLAGTARATPASAPADRAMLAELRSADLRLATVAFRIATRGVALCPRTRSLSGLLVHDSPQYAPELRDAADAVFGFGDGAGIEAVVPGSPADLAGLRGNDRLRAVDGVPVATPPGGARAELASADALAGTLEAAFDRGPVTLAISRDGAPDIKTVTGVPG